MREKRRGSRSGPEPRPCAPPEQLRSAGSLLRSSPTWMRAQAFAGHERFVDGVNAVDDVVEIERAAPATGPPAAMRRRSTSFRPWRLSTTMPRQQRVAQTVGRSPVARARFLARAIDAFDRFFGAIR